MTPMSPTRKLHISPGAVSRQRDETVLDLIHHPEKLGFALTQFRVGHLGVSAPLLESKCRALYGEHRSNTSLRPEKENGHADTMLHSTGCGAENYVGY